MDEGSDTKGPRRKRVSRACDRCRNKKDKCDGLRPACSACRASGQTCSYDPNAKKRGLPEGYVRGMEKLWALSICNIEGFEDTMLNLLGATPESAAPRRGKLISLWTDDGASDTLHESWKSSRLYGALEKMLSSSSSSSSSNPASSPSQTIGKRSRENHDSITSTADWGFRINRSETPSIGDAPRVVNPSSSPRLKRARLSLPAENQPSSEPPSNSTTNTLQLPPQTPGLLDVYFSVTHSWFPIVAKHNILRASYLYANAPLPVTDVSTRSGDHAALWAILSYTVSQSHADNEGASDLLANTRTYYSIAQSLIPPENARYELGHVQAILLLALVDIGLEEWTAAWLMSGKAARMAISMDLGVMADTMRRSEDLRLAKAVFLGCFLIDSLLSFRVSRRPCMHPRDLSSIGLLEEDGLEEWNSWADVLPPVGTSQAKTPPRRGPIFSLSCFNRLVELASVLNKIARDCSAGPNNHTFAQQMVLELKQWDDHLPLGCRLIGPESIYPERHSALLPHQSYLGLIYMATLLWLYLRIVPEELGLHHSQRPATEGAKKLLYRALPMISQQLENFPTCKLPPVFEMSLRTIAEQAFALRTMVESDSFPFAQWTEALVKQTRRLSPAWPAYPSLLTTIERWYTSSSDFSEMPSLSFQRPMEVSMSRTQPTTANTSAKPDLASSILGISIPADGQYMTPKDTTMDGTDLAMIDAFQPPTAPTDNTPTLENPPTVNSADLQLPKHPHPPTPESSGSNQMLISSSTTDRAVDPSSAPTSDIDAIFKDLAYLDTTEWTSNREAGLRDFGFIDDNTFQAFCHDPDRLAGSEPLVHPPSIEDIWPPPGFFPETFQDERMST